uniref:Uncharacterized protein n=1 Tax=Avena sativa TaxID=4498 RepID=A0ACD5TQG6_AVESA
MEEFPQIERGREAAALTRLSAAKRREWVSACLLPRRDEMRYGEIRATQQWQTPMVGAAFWSPVTASGRGEWGRRDHLVAGGGVRKSGEGRRVADWQCLSARDSRDGTGKVGWSTRDRAAVRSPPSAERSTLLPDASISKFGSLSPPNTHPTQLTSPRPRRSASRPQILSVPVAAAPSPVLIMWGLVYSRRKGSVQEGTHCVGAPHDSASLITGNIQNTEVRGLVDTRRKRACQEGTHGIGTPHGSASFSKGNIQNTEDSEDSVAVASVVPEAGDTAFQIHCLRRSAYAAVLRAFCAQSDLFSRVKQECLAELRKELTISDNEHREYVVKASTNKHIKSLNAWLYEGNNGNADAVKESVDLKRVVPDSGDSAFQIHCLERSAYAFVLRAFYAKPNLLSWARLLTKLRNELRLSYIEHREVIARVNSNNYIKSLRKFRLANYSGLTEKTPAFDLIAVGPDKISKTGQSFTSLAPESPMPAHMMSPARNIGILGTSYSTRKGLCSDPDTIAPVKKLKSGSGSALAYFKSLPCAEQLPEPIFSVLMESSKHGPVDSKTSPCTMKATCTVSPMFQGKHNQSNAGLVPWCVHKGMEASRERGPEASPMSRSKGLSVAITYSAANVDHGSDIIKIPLTSSLVNKVCAFPLRSNTKT